MPVDLEPQNWANTYSTILAAISIIITFFPFIKKIWEKISKTIFYKKIESKTSIYYIWGRKRKFLIIGAILLITGISIFSISIYQIIYPSPVFQDVTVIPIDFIEEGRGGIYGMSEPGDTFITINKNQTFLWKRGWSENNKLKSIKINYTTLGTQIMIGLGSNLTPYSLNSTAGVSTLELDNSSILYDKNQLYGIGILNVGENPIYLFNIKANEEVSKLQGISLILFLVGYILMILSLYSFKKHIKLIRADKTPSPDLLRKEAAFIDRIKNIEIELEVYQNTLKTLDNLNLKGDISTNLYIVKKNQYEENINKLNSEKDSIVLEIKNIIKKFTKEQILMS